MHGLHIIIQGQSLTDHVIVRAKLQCHTEAHTQQPKKSIDTKLANRLPQVSSREPTFYG